MSASVPLELRPSAFAGLIGAARRDTTPPPGIYARMWGAAAHDRATGTHRPLSATALALSATAQAPVRLLVAIDLPLFGDLGNPSDEERLLGPVRDALELGEGRLIVNCSHTHAAPRAATSRRHLPGGELLGAYLDQIGRAICEAGREAVAALAPATLTWATGRCDLATNRDLADPGGSARYLCGYNPAAAADDTLVVGRVTRDGDGSLVATLVNYACHPTTLAWENTRISPDFVGSMRSLVEQHTAGAPCLFLQGASGELSPAYQYVGDADVADQHGRRLGFSALAALSAMLAPGHGLAYDGVEESGAPLALWRPRRFAPSRALSGEAISVRLPLKPLASVEELDAQLAATDERVLKERLLRRAQIVRGLGHEGEHPFPAWVWLLGDSLLVAQPNEAYSCFQQELRSALAGRTVVVANTSGVGQGYLYPAALEGLDLYQVWQSPFAPGALRTLTDRCVAEARRLLDDAGSGD